MEETRGWSYLDGEDVEPRRFLSAFCRHVSEGAEENHTIFQLEESTVGFLSRNFLNISQG
jgi:hypothetical protein